MPNKEINIKIKIPGTDKKIIINDQNFNILNSFLNLQSFYKKYYIHCKQSKQNKQSKQSKQNIKNIKVNKKSIFVNNTDFDIKKIFSNNANLQLKKNKLTKKEISKLISFIDLTSLNSFDTTFTIKKMVEKIKKNNNSIAGICIFFPLIKYARKIIDENKLNNIKIVTVAMNFPHGMGNLKSQLLEIKEAINLGADEVDIVLNRSDFFSKKYQKIFNQIYAAKEICKDKILKVILETGELKNYNNISLASQIAIYAGADFLKTSTGKIPYGANISDVFVMLQIIKDYYDINKKKIGIKPSGGIKNINQAISYLFLVQEFLGYQWLSPSFFRLGASSLLDDLNSYI